MSNKSLKIGIIGSGGWGTAVAVLLAANRHEVRLWAFEPELVSEINEYHTNSIFLPGVIINKSVTSTNRLEEMSGMDFFVIATPTQFIRSTLADHKDIFAGKAVINLAKGIENKTYLRVSEILEEVIDLEPERYAVLTGPSHAEEVIRMTPTTVVVASENRELSSYIQKAFISPSFRVYTSNDVPGCEIGGALKNVIAIAAGIIDGLEIGDNTKAALITRGLAEMSRLGKAIGADPLTFSGLSGLGDLFVTCSSIHSRNRMVGELIGKGHTLNQILGESKTIAEGVSTTESAYKLGKKINIEMPITEQMYEILFKNVHPIEAIRNLMTRQSKKELWW